ADSLRLDCTLMFLSSCAHPPYGAASGTPRGAAGPSRRADPAPEEADAPDPLGVCEHVRARVSAPPVRSIPRSGNMAAAPSRSRRSVLAVPASNPRFIEKARGLAADAFFLDLEDAVAPSEKDRAREAAVAALNEGGWGGRTRTVRVNDLGTAWTYRDVVAVVEGAGADLDCLVLPKVTEAAHVRWLDLLLTQIERATGLEPGRIGIEAQIEDARGLAAVDA